MLRGRRIWERPLRTIKAVDIRCAVLIRSVGLPLTEPQQLNQARQRATALPQEVASKDLVSGSTVLHRDSQALAQEDLKLTAQLVRVLQRWRSVRGDQEEGLEGFLVQIWRLRLDHLDGHDAKGPHIDFGTIFFLLDNLGGHPVRCANHGGALGFLVSEFGAEAKISYNTISQVSMNTFRGVLLLILTFPRASSSTLSLLISR